MENHARRQAKFNRQIRVARLSTARRSAGRQPQAKYIFADPDRQITVPPQAFVVLSPVCHPMLLLRDLVTTISIELGRHLQHPAEREPHHCQTNCDRVAIARALVGNPEVVFADEPTAALDKDSGMAVVVLLKRLGRARGTMTVMITHDNRILDQANRILTLEDG